MPGGGSDHEHGDVGRCFIAAATGVCYLATGAFASAAVRAGGLESFGCDDRVGAAGREGKPK